MARSNCLSLQKSFLFCRLDPSDLCRIRDISQVRSFEPQETIFREGEAATGFFVVLRGRVKVFKLSRSGEEHILHIVDDGGSVAEAILFGSLERYPAFAETLIHSDLLRVPRRDFLELMKSDFRLTLSVLASLSEKLRFFNGLIEELSLKNADARLAKYFLDVAMAAQSGTFTLDIKKSEISRRLGIVPETFSRIVRKMSKQRILRISKKQIHILDHRKLERLSSGEPLR